MNTPVRPEHSGLPAQVWLASRSPRRLELLETLGLKVQVFLAQSSSEAEALEAPFEHEDPLLYVQRVTQLKLNAALEAMRSVKAGKNAAIIGHAKSGIAGRVEMKTIFGGARIVEMLVGEQLPRIC